jgi:hypothetical protein
MKYWVNKRIIPSFIRKGTKMLSISIKNVKFIDSLSFLPMALKKFPETFGIESQIEKEYFLFYFNTSGNESYRGNWPGIEFYDPNQMEDKEREKFIEWYNEQKDKEFVFLSEIEKYFRNDVDILKRCCMTFRQMFKRVSEIDPFSRSITIAQSAQSTNTVIFIFYSILVSLQNSWLEWNGLEKFNDTFTI